jgi:Ca2+-binding EF-hand superfamily protein
LAKELQKPDTDPEILGQLSERINTTFHMLDLNHDGYIGRDEWVKTCQFFGVDQSTAEKSFEQIAENDKLEYLQSNDPNHISNCCLCFL